MTDPLAHIWAKSAAKGETVGESLSTHTGQLLTRLVGWRARNPRLALQTSRTDLFDLAAWAALLHDVGKAAKGFQAMVRAGPRFEHRHEVLSLTLVGKLDLDEETLGFVAAAVATHHKNASEVFELYPFGLPARTELLDELSSADEEAWDLWLSSWGTATLQKLGFAALPARRPLERSRALGRAMRVFETLVQRIEAEDATSPLATTVRTLRGLIILADHAGSAHEALARAPTLNSPAALVEASGKRFARGLEAHQRMASESVGHAIVVAPTGSGKTEAALLWAARQREIEQREAPVFYVLPYRASLNAMRHRIPTYGVSDDAVVLQHATATTALYGQLLAKGYGKAEATQSAKRERNLGRLMTASVRVLTPYQLLRAFFGLPGHDAILTDAAGGLFIFDELHAYDLERLALILAALGHLVRGLGAKVLAMSATFPRVLSTTLRGILGESTVILADRAMQDRFARHTLRLCERDLESSETLADVSERFRRGEAILLVASTVGRAQRLFDAARARLGNEGVSLLHGRFTGEDRTKKEQLLAARVGTGTARSTVGTLLVATQVVEVSLDIDFDVLFSDPAPLEALLQRFGRVNRGLRGGLRDVVIHTNHPEEAARVYEASTVARALAVLRPFADRKVEESDIQSWVDRTYEPIETEWQTELESRIDEAEQSVVRKNRPLDAHPELARLFDELFDGAEVVPECLASQYERLLEQEPLRAVGLHVPISIGQRHMLKHKQKLVRRGHGFAAFDVALVPYSEERGLDLTARDDEP